MGGDLVTSDCVSNLFYHVRSEYQDMFIHLLEKKIYSNSMEKANLNSTVSYVAAGYRSWIRQGEELQTLVAKLRTLEYNVLEVRNTERGRRAWQQGWTAC